VELRIVQGVIGLTLLGALVIFTAFPQIKPDWIQIGEGRDPRATNAAFNRRGVTPLERGAEHFLEQEWNKAIKELTQALAQDPNNTDALFMRAAAWQNLEEHAKALADLDAVVRLTPDDPDAHFARAESLDDLGNAGEAIAELNTVIRLAPNDQEAYRLRGHLREEGRDYAGALADYREATRLDPVDSWSLNNLAWLLATTPDANARDGQQALKTAKQAVKLDGGKQWNTLDTLAAACAEMGMFTEAERHQTDAIKLAPDKERSDLQSRLELYRAKRPYRLP